MKIDPWFDQYRDMRSHPCLDEVVATERCIRWCAFVMRTKRHGEVLVPFRHFEEKGDQAIISALSMKIARVEVHDGFVR